MKKMNKKLLMSLSVLATPFAVESLTENEAQANTQYTLNNSVKTYGTAQNALKQTNSNKTYTQGTYYVYKEHNGMINISKTPGKAGAWINPNTNTQVQTNPVATTQTTQTRQVSQPTASSQTVTNSSVYTVTAPQKVYRTAANAAAKVGSTATYQAGSYYIYKNYNGMLNVSKTQGRAGAWINPSERVTTNTQTSTVTRPVSPPTTTTRTTSQVSQPQTATTPTSGQYRLGTATKTYASAANASKKTGARSTYAAGNYYIYKTANGMLNISRTAGKPGAWINPADNVVVSTPPRTTTQTTTSKPSTTQSSKPQTQKPTTTTNKYDGLEYKARFELTSDTAAYANAANAKSGVGATSRYAKGSYFIYKNVNGMLNISKTPGKAGAWINPNATSSVTARQTAGSPSLQSFQYKNLNSKSNYTATELNRALNAFGGGSGKLAGRGDAFKKAESTYNVNALYLLSHAALESGWGKSKIAADKNNFFGIAAYDNSPYESASTFDGVEAGIMDGAKWISGRYLKSTSFPAAGAYLGDKSSGMNKNYATDPNWGYKIADIMNRINNFLGKKDR